MDQPPDAGLAGIDTRHLVTFQAVLDTGSFSAAARVLRCSQPAVSQQMRSLERALGGPLFARVGRGLRLTDAGEVLARRAGSILRELRAARQQVLAMTGWTAAALRVCAFPSANASLLPPVVGALAKRQPRIRLELLEAEPPHSLELLRRGDCEVAIGFGYDSDPADELAAGMLRVPLFDDPLVVLLPADHPLSERSGLSLPELAGEAWIAGCARCRRHFRSSCEAAGFEPAVVCTADDNLAIQSMVAAGLGVALVPRLVLASLRHPRLVAALLEPRSVRHVAAYTWADLARASAVGEVLEALRLESATMQP